MDCRFYCRSVLRGLNSTLVCKGASEINKAQKYLPGRPLLPNPCHAPSCWIFGPWWGKRIWKYSCVLTASLHRSINLLRRGAIRLSIFDNLRGHYSIGIFIGSHRDTCSIQGATGPNTRQFCHQTLEYHHMCKGVSSILVFSPSANSIYYRIGICQGKTTLCQLCLSRLV